ncbi:carboxypeptidase-like regulatory domain-containing protein [Singulisphaera rosea]
MRAGLSRSARFLIAVPAVIARPPARGLLWGTVLPPDRAPIQGARVWVNTTDRDAMAEAHTDRAGPFRLEPLRPVYRNPFDLLVDAPGFARRYGAKGSYSVYSGIDSDLGSIQVERGGILLDRLLDADATPSHHSPITRELSRNIRGEPVS